MTYPHYGSPAPMPAYGYAPPPQTGQDSRFMPLLIGWLAAFLMPIVYCILRFVFYGKDWVGILLIAGAVGPLFFGIQCLLNFVALAIPKWCKDSLAIFWGGMLVWWGSAAAFAVVPGWDFREEIKEYGDKAWPTGGPDGRDVVTTEEGQRYLEILDNWLDTETTLQHTLTIPTLAALAGIAIVVIGVVVAAMKPARPTVAYAPHWPGRPY